MSEHHFNALPKPKGAHFLSDDIPNPDLQQMVRCLAAEVIDLIDIVGGASPRKPFKTVAEHLTTVRAGVVNIYWQCGGKLTAAAEPSSRPHEGGV